MFKESEESLAKPGQRLDAPSREELSAFLERYAAEERRRPRREPGNPPPGPGSPRKGDLEALLEGEGPGGT
jgi:hypothetical protein